ncbi:hypothetical protein [Algihabitans albus]|uniref:hypothetical protein n=1 Tax=Algihabitans albus TaxID=2164067 RepID=UPI000E5CDC64|nr:hypothetical protein [Algihabitans albus]
MASQTAGEKTASDKVAAEQSSLGERGREAAGAARDAVKERVEATAEWSRDQTEGARRTVDRSAQKLRQGATKAGRRAKGVFDDYPLALGVLAFAGGFVLGTVLPRTVPENRYIGPLRDDLKERGLRESERLARQAREYAEESLRQD